MPASIRAQKGQDGGEIVERLEDDKCSPRDDEAVKVSLRNDTADVVAAKSGASSEKRQCRGDLSSDEGAKRRADS